MEVLGKFFYQFQALFDGEVCIAPSEQAKKCINPKLSPGIKQLASKLKFFMFLTTIFRALVVPSGLNMDHDLNKLVLVSSVFHCGYNLASVAVLQQVQSQLTMQRVKF